MAHFSDPPRCSWPVRVLLALGAGMALALPMLWSGGKPPLRDFVNQAWAWTGWALWALILLYAMRQPLSGSAPRMASPSVWTLWAVWWGVAACMAISGLRGLPWNFVCSALASWGSAAVILILATEVARRGWSRPVFGMLCGALLAAALVSAVFGLVQIFSPSTDFGGLILPGDFGIRVSANLRQSNHLATLLLWGGVALVFLYSSFVSVASPTRQWLVAILALGAASVLCFCLILTGSRTGFLGLLLLALWGVWGSPWPQKVRICLLAAPVVYALMSALWGHLNSLAGEAFTSRLDLQGNISSNRFAIWSNTLDLIAQYPWWGVGWGQFNRAWTLTPLPDRAPELFDHAHNLPLHWAAELGVPMALFLCALLAYGLWRMLWLARVSNPGPGAMMFAASTMMVLVVALHSQLEYPLWYAYFLLPTVFLMGLSLAHDFQASQASSPIPDSPQSDKPLALARLASVALLAGTLIAWIEHWRIGQMIENLPTNPTLETLTQRIEEAKRSWFFADQAHRVAALSGLGNTSKLESLYITSFRLFSPDLIMLTAEEYARQGNELHARFLADRFAEFITKPLDEGFQRVCDEAWRAQQPGPFQCGRASQTLTLKDFPKR
ncbi:MAG: Wzy polymerase domain-containing protein [Burkholderiales bacterium]